MEKTDLRIGNLVGIKETALHADGCNHSEAIFEIEEIKKDVVQFKGYHAGEYYKDLKPIPLTEQWLLDFGFVNDSNLHYRWTMGDILIYDIDDNCICISDTWEFGMRKYVHQLQNLYFALTQEELILKEITL